VLYRARVFNGVCCAVLCCTVHVCSMACAVLCCTVYVCSMACAVLCCPLHLLAHFLVSLDLSAIRELDGGAMECSSDEKECKTVFASALIF
jgi:hypothetical protein